MGPFKSLVLPIGIIGLMFTILAGCKDPAGTESNPPEVTVSSADTTVAVNQELSITVSASDNNGVALYYLDFNGDGTWDDSTADSTISHAWSSAGTDTVKVKVRDNDGVFSEVAVVLVVTVHAEYLFASTSDYQSGNMRKILVGDTTASSDLLSVNSDNRIRSHNGFIYVLERFGADNLMKIDPAKTGAGSVIYQKHLGTTSAAWNPADIVFVSGSKGFVSFTDYPVLLEVNLSDGSITDSISLRDFVAYAGTDTAESDADADRMVYVNGKIYLLLQRLGSAFGDYGDTALVLVIDASAKTIEKAIPLKSNNPGDLIVIGNSLYVSCTYDYTVGAIEEIDIADDTWKRTVVTESDLGGSPVSLARKSVNKLYVSVYEGWGSVPVKVLDLSSGTVSKKLDGISVSAKVTANSMGIVDAFGGLAVSEYSKRLFVGERATGGSGIVIFSTEDDSKIAGPVSTGLPPNSLAIVELGE